MSRPVRIACVGHASLDHVFEIERFPKRPTKTPAHRYQARSGGMAANAALAAARLGAAVRLIGRLGEDAQADYLRHALQGEAVDVAGLETVPGASTSVSSVVVDSSGERQIYNHRGNAIARAHALDTRMLEGADIVLADPRWPAGARAAFEWARRLGVPALLDADVAPAADLRALVPLANWAAFSTAGLALFSGAAETVPALRAATAAGCRKALVTNGANPVLWTSGARILEQAVPRIQARDTTGAGDVFHGALAVALAEGRADSAAIAFACRAAACKCRNGQGAQGAPTRAELEDFSASV
jgi:sulfofructose kinase